MTVLPIAAIGLRGTAPREARDELLAITPAEFSVLAAVADRVCFAPGGPTAWEARVPERVDALLHRVPAGTAVEIGQLLRLFDNGLAGLIDGRWTPFSQCDAATQDAVLRVWRRSAISQRRTAYYALSRLCLSAYWSVPEVRAITGYPGPPTL